MDNQRFILWVTLGFLLWLSYQAWQVDYGPQPSETARQPEIAEPIGGLPDSLPEITVEAPGESLGPSSTQSSTIERLGQPRQPTQTDNAPVVHVTTDVFDLDIGLQGGDIRRAILKAYPLAKDQPDTKVSLLSADPADLYQLQTGLRTTQGASAPDYQAWFRTNQPAYRLDDGEDELRVELHWNDGQGISAIKQYTFRRGEYGIQVETTVTNGSDASWTGADYLRIRRNNRKPERSMLDVETFSFTGPVFYDGEKYEKLDSDEIQEGEIDGTYIDAWVASIQHHFLTAAVPLAEREYAYRGSVRQNVDELLALGPCHVIERGQSHTFEGSLFVGPKMTNQLEELAKGLRLTVDYGWLTIISQPLFWLLNKVHGFIGNWGWAILAVTVLLKLLFFKLTETSGKSMAKMRKLQPRIKLLQERYKDDREALSKSMMELYKREKVNPVAGCLPMLVQMPVFLAFYWVLLESVEMRQAPFMLWITDLSSRDPYFILPVLMGAAMFGQFKLNPAPPDPVQAKVFMLMPLMMTGMMAFFPSGLVLYWFSNTLLSIAQQWRINKAIEATG